MLIDAVELASAAERARSDAVVGAEDEADGLVEPRSHLGARLRRLAADRALMAVDWRRQNSCQSERRRGRVVGRRRHHRRDQALDAAEAGGDEGGAAGDLIAGRHHGLARRGARRRRVGDGRHDGVGRGRRRQRRGGVGRRCRRGRRWGAVAVAVAPSPWRWPLSCASRSPASSPVAVARWHRAVAVRVGDAGSRSPSPPAWRSRSPWRRWSPSASRRAAVAVTVAVGSVAVASAWRRSRCRWMSRSPSRPAPGSR